MKRSLCLLAAGALALGAYAIAGTWSSEDASDAVACGDNDKPASPAPAPAPSPAPSPSPAPKPAPKPAGA